MVAGAKDGQAVTLSARTAEQPLAAIASTVTTTGGAYSFTQVPSQNSSYRVSSGGVSSSVLFEGVKYALTAAANVSSVASGQTVTILGTVSPVRQNKSVYIERQNASGIGFHVINTGPISNTGGYSIATPLYGLGKVVLRVKVPGDPDNQSVASSTFPIEVTPATPAALQPVAPVKLPSEGQV